MNKETTSALQQLTGKSDINEVPVEELQQIVEAHPYFSAAQLLLSQKLKQSDVGDRQKQLHKTALFFPNQQWLNYLLLGNGEKKTEVAQSFEAQPETVQEDAEAQPEEIVSTVETEDIPIDSDTKSEEIPTQTEDANLITLPAGQILEDITDTDSSIDEPEEISLDEDELQEQSEPLPAESNQKISKLLSGQAEQFNKPVEEKTETPVAGEPFHTIDYFASQGIKLEAIRGENQFDRKVHKFTDWLRQMKRINPHPVDLGTEAEEETFVANIADSSNYTKEILTESMADVLIKQGKKDKAVEIYQKLSLLNPDKSTYFAALIQTIK